MQADNLLRDGHRSSRIRARFADTGQHDQGPDGWAWGLRERGWLVWEGWDTVGLETSVAVMRCVSHLLKASPSQIFNIGRAAVKVRPSRVLVMPRDFSVAADFLWRNSMLAARPETIEPVTQMPGFSCSEWRIRVGTSSFSRSAMASCVSRDRAAALSWIRRSTSDFSAIFRSIRGLFGIRRGSRGRAAWWCRRICA